MKIRSRRWIDTTFQLLLSIIGFCYWTISLVVFIVGKLFSFRKKAVPVQNTSANENIYIKFMHFVHSHGAGYTYNVMKDNIEPFAKILDIGMGSGYLAKKIQVEKHVKIIGIDVANFSKVDITDIVFDGVTIPFPDASFDIGILAFVLHHAQDQISLLKEAKRTCKKLIVLEDNLISQFGVFLGRAHSSTFKLLYSTDTNCTYHSPEEWQVIFNKLGFTVKSISHGWKPDCFVYPVKAVKFVLE